MAAAKVNYGILTSYSHTMFFVRSEVEPTAVYFSSIYNTTHPILLYYAAFLTAASEPEKFSLSLPEVPNLDEELRKARDKIVQMEQKSSEDYGIIF